MRRRRKKRGGWKEGGRGEGEKEQERRKKSRGRGGEEQQDEQEKRGRRGSMRSKRRGGGGREREKEQEERRKGREEEQEDLFLSSSSNKANPGQLQSVISYLGDLMPLRHVVLRVVAAHIPAVLHHVEKWGREVHVDSIPGQLDRATLGAFPDLHDPRDVRHTCKHTEIQVNLRSPVHLNGCISKYTLML